MPTVMFALIYRWVGPGFLDGLASRSRKEHD